MIGAQIAVVARHVHRTVVGLWRCFEDVVCCILFSALIHHTLALLEDSGLYRSQSSFGILFGDMLRQIRTFMSSFGSLELLTRLFQR